MAGAHVHMVCGSTGAGKTTYAIGSATRLGAPRFSIDQWMTALFWMDSTDPIDPAWAIARVRRCCEQIWTVSVQMLNLGVPVLLDLGFTTAKDRWDFARRAANIHIPVTLHVLDVPVEERWRRVERRNADQDADHDLGFAVTRAMFDYVETLWEPPSEEEMVALNGFRTCGVDPALRPS